MEAFDITFFCLREKYDNEIENIIAMEFQKYNIFQKKSLVEYFCEDEKDFIEYRLSIFDLIIAKKDFTDIITKLSQFTGVVFERAKDILFATGIYELTYYFTENKKNILEFDKEFIQNFPIVFLRKGERAESGRIIYSDINVTCVFHENAQSIF